MDLYFQGLACFNKGPAPENLARARGFLERAVALDPNNIDALVQIALVDVVSGAALFSADRTARLASAEAAAAKVLSLAPDHAVAHMCIGMVQNFTNRAAQGLDECELALTLDRNLAGAHGHIGFAKIALGHDEETEAHIQQAPASLLGIQLPMSGRFLPAWPSSISEEMRRRSHGCGAASISTEIMPPGNSILRPLWRSAANWTRQEPLRGGRWRSVRPSPSAVSAPAHRARIRSISQDANARSRACARLVCRKDDDCGNFPPERNDEASTDATM